MLPRDELLMMLRPAGGGLGGQHREHQLLVARADPGAGRDREQLLEAASHSPSLRHAVLFAGHEHDVELRQILGTRPVVGAGDEQPPGRRDAANSA